MSRGVARIGVDFAGGGVAITGSLNVRANGLGIVRLLDRVASHGLPPHSPTPPMITSSSTVRVNGRGVVRLGDFAKCGHVIGPGSFNIFAG